MSSSVKSNDYEMSSASFESQLKNKHNPYVKKSEIEISVKREVSQKLCAKHSLLRNVFHLFLRHVSQLILNIFQSAK